MSDSRKCAPEATSAAARRASALDKAARHRPSATSRAASPAWALRLAIADGPRTIKRYGCRAWNPDDGCRNLAVCGDVCGAEADRAPMRSQRPMRCSLPRCPIPRASKGSVPRTHFLRERNPIRLGRDHALSPRYAVSGVPFTYDHPRRERSQPHQRACRRAIAHHLLSFWLGERY